MSDIGTNVALGLLKAVIYTCDVVTLPLHVIFQQPWNQWLKSRSVWARPVNDNPASPFIRAETGNENPIKDVKTVDELMRKAILRFPNRQCFGTREVFGEEEEKQPDGKSLKKFVLGDYKWMTFQEAGQKIEQISRSFNALGASRDKPVMIFAETRVEWMLTTQACFRLGVPVATLYATLGEDGIIHGINETETSILITSQDLLPKLMKNISKLPTVKHIICMEGHKPTNISGFPDTVKVMTFSQFEALGSNQNGDDSLNYIPKPDDVAVIMYTSGSTGVPKGVLISHTNLLTTIKGFLEVVGLDALRNGSYLAYLPLAHILELCVECFMLGNGVMIGYSSPLTMTDKSTAIKAGQRGDAVLVQPTILTAVPLVLDRIRKSVTEVIESKGPFAKGLFQFALQYKAFWSKFYLRTPLLDRIVFRKIRDLVGGRVTYIPSGGAPLSPETHEFIRYCLGCKLFQGYGLTETAGAATLMDLNDLSTGRVGPVLPDCYLRLTDWEEGGYHVSDSPHPRGEIIIGGNCVTIGYFKKDDLTKESYFEQDGIRWFRTGDIGEIYKDGTVKVIDRKKDLVKLQYGEYISLGKVETELKTCPLVDNICVYGNSFQTYLVALIIPNQRHLALIASELGKDDHSLLSLYDDPEIIAAVGQRIKEHALRCKLHRTEIPSKIKLCKEEWTPDSGLVTAAFKLRRSIIQKFYQEDIDLLYAKETVSSASSSRSSLHNTSFVLNGGHRGV